MIKDLDRDIYTIKYNVLNLPDVIQFKNGNQIKNLYDAGGHKLGTEYFTWRPGTNAPIVNAGDLLNISYSQTSTDQTGTAYIGNIEYNTLNGNASLTTLSRIYNDEGYVENPANPQYYYFRHDHLGDNREVWCANTNTVAQRTQYYPSGLPFAYDRTLDHPDLQHRKYNGKEFVEMHGYDTYDYGYRGYYAAIGRWMNIDQLAEKYYSISPYVYCLNNPVMRIDPDGRIAPLAVAAIGFAGKALVGGGIDFVAQMGVNLATNGGQWGDAISNVDWTGVGASSLAAGLTAPGMSTLAKGVVALSTIVDASVDYTIGKGPTNIVDGSKSRTAGVIDLVAGSSASAASNKLVKGFQSAVKSDLTSTAVKTLNKAELSSLKTMDRVANGKMTEQSIKLLTKFTSGAIAGTTKELVKTNESSSTPIPLRPKENSYSLIK